MSRLEENRYLPVFALLALIITLQSFLIGEDRKQDGFDKPVISQATPFVTSRSRADAPKTPPSHDPTLATAREGGNPSPDMSGPPAADAEKDAGWVPYQAGALAPEDEFEEPGATPPGAPGAAASPAADETKPLAEETSFDEAEPATSASKDEWARPVPLDRIIQEATAPPVMRATVERPPAMTAEPRPQASVASVGPDKVTTIEVDIGDNLWRIAKRYHVSGEDILKTNKLSSGVLLPGQVLVIPAGEQTVVPPGFEIVRVREGETAIDVANRLGVPLIELVRENDLASLYQIPAGTALRYRKPGAEPAPHASVAAAPPPAPNPEKTGMLFPVAGKVGDRFGWRKHPILGETLFHTGVDLRAPRGEIIHSALDGRVIYAGWLRGYGQTMVVRHVGGYTTRYAHCSQLLKKRGDKVKRGEKIAKVGSSGLSTGPHVHFEVRLLGKPINPLKFLKRSGARS